MKEHCKDLIMERCVFLICYSYCIHIHIAAGTTAKDLEICYGHCNPEYTAVMTIAKDLDRIDAK